MKLLPKEHGASAIWFSSVIFALTALPKPPWFPGIVIFLVVSIIALVVTGRLTGGSKIIMRMERNAFLLPVLSSLLTLLVPVGQMLMVWQLSVQFLAIWIVFLTYCVSGVVYTRDMVRSVLKDSPLRWASFILSVALVTAEIVSLSAFDWLSLTAFAVVIPLMVHRIIVLLLMKRKDSSKIERIRAVGFTQAGNLVAAALILAWVLRF